MPVKESSLVLDWALRIMLAICTAGNAFIYQSVGDIQKRMSEMDKSISTYSATSAVQLSAAQASILDLQKRVLDISAQQIRNVSKIEELERDNGHNPGPGLKPNR